MGSLVTGGGIVPRGGSVRPRLIRIGGVCRFSKGGGFFTGWSGFRTDLRGLVSRESNTLCDECSEQYIVVDLVVRG